MCKKYVLIARPSISQLVALHPPSTRREIIGKVSYDPTKGSEHQRAQADQLIKALTEKGFTLEKKTPKP